MAFDIAGLHGLADNVALTVRDIEATQVTLESNRVALVARVQALADADWEGGLLEKGKAQYDEIAVLRRKIKTFVDGLCDQSLNVTGLSLSAWYAANRAIGNRLPPEFGQLVRVNAGKIDPRYIWPPFETQMADAAFPGAAGDQDIESAPIDTEQYAGAILKTKVKTAIIQTSDTTNLLVTINGTQYNGDAWQGTASIPHGSIVGFELAVTPAIPDTFCTAITSMVFTIVGGGGATWTQGEIDVLTNDDRTPAQ